MYAIQHRFNPPHKPTTFFVRTDTGLVPAIKQMNFYAAASGTAAATPNPSDLLAGTFIDHRLSVMPTPTIKLSEDQLHLLTLPFCRKNYNYEKRAINAGVRENPGRCGKRLSGNVVRTSIPSPRGKVRE